MPLRLLAGAIALGAALASGAPSPASGNDAPGPIPVRLIETTRGWSLQRGGQPYFIRGAGGDGDLAALAAAGANSLRTWGADDIGGLLDAAHAHGLSVTVGIWLGHERHGFDYGDPVQVAGQLERVRETVLQYRDHPAVLIWALGNEMEGFAAGDDPRIWDAVNDAAALVKQLDPNHPTMTVTADIGGARVPFVHERSPAIDIHGINSYGGAATLSRRLREAGATKPFIVTEFGPPGPWEVDTTPWGAPFEPTSTGKVPYYVDTVRRLAADDMALGGYAFLWGAKMEGTPTWFGMFLPDGTALAAVDALTTLWSGAAPENRAPSISPIDVGDETVVDGRALVTASVDVLDPDDDPVALEWLLLPEAEAELTGGDFRPRPIPIDDAILSAEGGDVAVRLPEDPGGYRLFAVARDGRGKGATANLPLRVRGEPRVHLPLYVYDDGFDGMRWAPSGWMGNIDALTLDGNDTTHPHTGDRAIRLRYEGTYGWVGVAWQHPPNDWGDAAGGFDVTGANALEVWARGQYGGEKVSFGVGLIEADRPFPDSVIARLDGITLTDQWQRYVVPLRGKDLATVKTGFVVTMQGRRSPVTVYLDRIRFVR